MAGTVATNSVPDMEVTPERALAIKRALIRQYADQYGLEIDGWTERTEDGRTVTVAIVNDKAVVQSVKGG